MPKEISQEAGSKNKFGFLLICTAAQFRMLWKPVTLHDCKWKKKMKQIHGEENNNFIYPELLLIHHS